MLWGLAINAHSYPLLWRIALSPVSTSLGNPQPMTGWHRIQRIASLPQSWTTCVVWFPLQSIHGIRLKLGSTWDYVLAHQHPPANPTPTPPTHHFLLPLYPFSLEQSLHTSLSQKTSIPIPAQALLLGDPSLIHGKNGTGKVWWQGNNLGGFCNNSVKKYWFFSFLTWNSMTLDRILPVVIASSLALFCMLGQTQVKLAHEAV